MNSCKCELCKIEVHRSDYAKHLRRKKHFDNEEQNEMYITEWLFQEPIENKLFKL